MSSRRRIQTRVNSVQISATLTREMHDFAESLIDRRMVKNRSHALNLGLECLQWMIVNNPGWFLGDRSPIDSVSKPRQPQPVRQPQPDRDLNYPR